MRDAHLFSVTAERAGAHALAGVLQDVTLGHYASFMHEWVADGGARALSGGPAALAALRYVVPSQNGDGAASHDADDGVSGNVDGADLPREIERKYLLSGCPPEAALVPGVRVEQGWLPGTSLRERLRRSSYPTGAVRFTRTVKLGRGISRVEVEEQAEPALFEQMWPLTAQARVYKQRHVIHEDPYTWEIDVFADRDLVLAEVELDDESVTPEIPAWLAPWLVREVTGEPEYLNSNLARASAE